MRGTCIAVSYRPILEQVLRATSSSHQTGSDRVGGDDDDADDDDDDDDHNAHATMEANPSNVSAAQRTSL
jgi:hypothetical protein